MVMKILVFPRLVTGIGRLLYNFRMRDPNLNLHLSLSHQSHPFPVCPSLFVVSPHWFPWLPHWFPWLPHWFPWSENSSETPKIWSLRRKQQTNQKKKQHQTGYCCLLFFLGFSYVANAFDGKHLSSCSFFLVFWGNVGVETSFGFGRLVGWLAFVAKQRSGFAQSFGRLLLVLFWVLVLDSWTWIWGCKIVNMNDWKKRGRMEKTLNTFFNHRASFLSLQLGFCLRSFLVSLYVPWCSLRHKLRMELLFTSQHSTDSLKFTHWQRLCVSTAFKC